MFFLFNDANVQLEKRWKNTMYVVYFNANRLPDKEILSSVPR